ncbi:MAG: hypothetical protein M1820_010148 [Bogoriella megaspora]|nr:MAG: hypothetical protein M1820_010148 [Bogoriella megaspora]
MALIQDNSLLPDSESPDLGLAHPTDEECIKIWEGVSTSWKDSLTVPIFLEESKYLTTVPLATGGGMTMWILVDKNRAPNARTILCSCETFIKRAIASNAEGEIEDGIVHETKILLRDTFSEEFPKQKARLLDALGLRYGHRYYGRPDAESPHNVLYILRLVIEGDDSRSRPLQGKPVNHLSEMEALKSVMEAAEAEAAAWQLDCVKLWDPTPLAQELLIETGLEYQVVEREEDSIASGLWYGVNGQEMAAPVWINNEHYSWL